MPQQFNKLQHKLLIIAKSEGREDCLEALTEMVDEVSDIRNRLGGLDSVEVRNAIALYLQGKIQQIKALAEKPITASDAPDPDENNGEDY